MKQKVFATLASACASAFVGFAIGYVLSSGSIGGWISFPKAALGLLFATYLALTNLVSSTLLSFASDRTSKTWWIYVALSVVFTVFANIALSPLGYGVPPFSLETFIPTAIFGIANGLTYFFAERYAIRKLGS